MKLTFVYHGVSLNGKSVEVPFQGFSELHIGSGATCHFRVQEPSISVRHALVRMTAAGPVLVDGRSRNGTWVNGDRVTADRGRLLRDGDKIRVGRLWFDLRISSGDETVSDSAARTTGELALQALAEAMEASSSAPLVRVVEGTTIGETVPLVEDEKLYRIGRSSRCEIALMDVDVSREHAYVVRRGADVYLIDLGSKNGVTLGANRLSPRVETLWPSALTARMGNTGLALEPVRTIESLLEHGIEDSSRRFEVEASRPADDGDVDPKLAVAESRTADVRAHASSPRLTSVAPDAASLLPSSAPTEKRVPAPVAAVVEDVHNGKPLVRRRGGRHEWLIVFIAVLLLVGAVLAAIWIFASQDSQSGDAPLVEAC